MADPVSVCNQALASIGTRSTITSLDDGSPEALACLQIYDNTRRKTLRGAPWGMAKYFERLTLYKAAPGTPENPDAAVGPWTNAYPAPPWLYSYVYPSTALWMRFLIPQQQLGGFTSPLYSTPVNNFYQSYTGPAVKYSIASDQDDFGNKIRIILCNQQTPIACFNTDVTDCNLWDDDFLDAMVFGLAAQLAMTLTGNLSITKANYELANAKMLEARKTDNNESIVQQDIIPDFIRARGGYGYANEGLASNGLIDTVWAGLWPVPV
jgi:hypothetical protein